ncbi:MAG: DUF2071 domain-containing protein [Chloroflexi bacterium]|nr:DUF2071 domain-containing protein [Chloroflexota bacterium]MBI3764592.1 DUF2071 domain-containing protein [Chloroflexota bacterium]
MSLTHTAHRPWPLPTGPWVQAQVWHDLLFAHWPVPVDDLRRHIPASLEIDAFDGQAWIGVVPFRMSGVRPRLLPAVPWFSAFPELNVRTYVRLGDKPGVWFFSLDASNPVIVEIARAWYNLPYFTARMSLRDDGATIRYESRRTHRGALAAEFVGRYRPTGDAVFSRRGTLEHWLTERYCLYTTDRSRQLHRAEIHHIPWPLQPAEAEIEVNTMAQPHGIELPDAPPVLYFARRLEVVVWPLKGV